MTGRVEACIKLAKKVGLKNKIVLDVGCSDGWFSKIAIDEGAKEIYAVEPDDEKLKIARKTAPKAKIIKGVAGKLEFPENKFDIAVLFDVIEHVPKNSEPQVLNEIQKVLKESGYLLLSTPFQFWPVTLSDAAWYFGHRHYSEKQLKELLKKSGFRVIEFNVLGGFWEVVAMWFLYISKWVFRVKMPFEEWFDSRRREEFNKKGKAEIFLIAQKI